MFEEAGSALRNSPAPCASPLSLFSRRRPLFWLAMCVCLGIFLDQNLTPSLNALAASAGVLLLSAAACVIFPRRNFFGQRTGVLLCAAVSASVACALGAYWHAARFRVARADDVTQLTPERPCFARLRGVIVEAEWKAPLAGEPSARYGNTHWIVALDALGSARGTLRPARGRVRLTLHEKADDASAPTLAEGDEIECTAKLEPLPAATLPEGFDYGGYLRGRGVGRIGSAEFASVEHIAAPAWWQAGLQLRRLSGSLSLRTRDILGGSASEEQAGLLNAMLFGRREALSGADREAFSINGTAHLLAISGLHVQLICLVLYYLLGWCGLTRRSAALWVLGASIGYCLLTGASPPAIRASAMLGAYVGAGLFWREGDPLNALASAALLVLFLAPHELFSVGFQLSFLAVFSLFTLLPAFEDAWDAWRLSRTKSSVLAQLEAETEAQEFPVKARIKRRLRQALTLLRKSCFITLAAWLATTPAVAWHMGRISTLSLAANLFAVPLLSCCMFPGMAAVLADLFWPALGKLLGSVALFFVTLLEKLNAYCAAIPGASLDTPRPPLALLLVIAALLSVVWITRGRPRPLRRVLLLLTAAIAVLLSTVLLFEKPQGPELWFFDLPRGNSVLLTGPQGSALIDAGEAGEGARIAESLRRTGHARLDLLVITADEPAAIGGALELSRIAIPKRVLLPRAKFPSETRRAFENFLNARGIPYSAPKAGETLSGPGAWAWTFSNDGAADDAAAKNNSTLFTRINTGAFTILIAPAKSSASLDRWLAKSGELTADVLGLFSGKQQRWPKECAGLIARVAPAVLVAGGAGTADEFPGLDFDALVARIYSTGQEGTVKISRAPGAAELRVETYRNGWHP